ncbi:MAG: hypothetical protein FJY07_04830 [Bacteroidetes bacterium]|nr:hypothetical protein [Bacteroidota bacterium]
METTERRMYHRPGVLRWVGWIAGGIVLAVILAFIFGYFVMLLWNWIMPTLFGLPEIDYWLAFGIIILARLIFGGFGHGSHHHKSSHHDRYYGSKFRNKCRPPFDRHNKWHHYEDFWKEEGEEAFDRYIEKKHAGSGSHQSTNPAE